MNRDEPIVLSRAGSRRREEILRLAEGALADRERRRRSQRALATAAMLAFAVLAVAWLARSPSRPSSGPALVDHAPKAASIDLASLDLPYRLEIIDDAKLARELAAVGAGMVRIGVDHQRLVATDGTPFVQPAMPPTGGLPAVDPGTS